MAFAIFKCLVFSSFIALIEANGFLHKEPKEQNERLSEDDIRTSLLEEVEGTLGTGTASKRVAQIELALKPIFAALPKNEHDKLGHATVRYAMHRLFILRHGWSIKGLHPHAFNSSSSPAGVLQDQVPTYIQDLFEKRLGAEGFSLHELAVLAATIEHLIHDETVNKLGEAFNVHQILPIDVLSEMEADTVLDTYMMAYIIGQNLSSMTLGDARELASQMPEIYADWQSTQKFVRDIRQNVTAVDNLNFATLSQVAETVGEEFGSFQVHECQKLKDSLMELENKGTGRVKISDFYKPALGGKWQFQESVAYLRQVGALDESDSNEKSVLIANYLYSQANCIASSGFYSVCCKDECENLLGHLEEKLAAPEATPAAIKELIRNLSSSTVASPREISQNLQTRLDEISIENGGLVPLHGRLFAQWMHHAYPRECPYPHLSGTVSPQTPDEWLNESGTDSVATEEEMLQFVKAGNSTDRLREAGIDNFEDLLPWTPEEELLVTKISPTEKVTYSTLSSAQKSLVLLAAAASLAFGLIQSVKDYSYKPNEISKLTV
jgi:hypothetical protein|mmetsp:Transcript_124950/g.195789  ORF Transcript_124950/g.195789 Transcript_124950/m.195789 type:complete len:552 (+) Transcript_124950:101-1756(+)|eukprot:CAMPEP_0169119996 /NCGR_PEP_ID=MMETSP1015-20121227/31862_1 /TAXON_ID=342587 /ORGANISM="Karlodinium micrum, Strain CCMP2283" /LENGTH=551 /DNA_ID=CAMNT_0009182929 /DNA_START=101 /DNA_END=1756 /DNA_ORIENTATION=+